MISRPLLALVVAALAAGCTLAPLPGAYTPYYEEILQGAPFTTLVIQVDHAPGRAPSEAAKTHLLMTLQNVTHKREIRWDVKQTLPDEPTARWTPEALVELERTTRRTPHAAPNALLHVIYPAGLYNNTGAAGVTISGPVIGPVVVFLDKLREISIGTPLGVLPTPNPRPAVDVLERSTLLHEAGHAMGLVNNGLTPVNDHEDLNHRGHSRHRDSVMYWAVDTENGLRQLLFRDGSVPDRFHEHDLADLRSAGGK